MFFAILLYLSGVGPSKPILQSSPSNQVPQLAKPGSVKAVRTLDVPEFGTPITLPPMKAPPEPETLLDERGFLRRRVSLAERKAWADEVHHGVTRGRHARLQILLGEYEIGRREPGAAETRFRTAASLSSLKVPDKGLALFDLGISLFRQGKFPQSRDVLFSLLKSTAFGYDRHQALLLGRHAAACAGYHAEHAALGIPQPQSLDPLCGVSSLAVCLRGRSLPYEKRTVANNIPHNGEGSTMRDLLGSLPRIGLVGRVVFATDKGLQSLPKPVVVHIERDHFVAITKANRNGVTYVCSDCGTWPGGSVHLNWTQWHAMNADEILAVAKPNSPEAVALEHLPSSGQTITAANSRHARPQKIQMAAAAQRLLSSMVNEVVGQAYPYVPASACGLGGSIPNKMPPFAPCPMDTPGCRAPNGSPLEGDPINTASGEEEYSPKPDITVYNPIGPSVTWSRSYQALSKLSPTGWGVGWSHSYNWRIERSDVSGTWQTALRMPTGPLLPITPTLGESVPPTPGASTRTATLPPGTPYLIDWRYVPGSSSPDLYYYRLTFSDGSIWTFAQETILPVLSGGQYEFFYPVKIEDKFGNFIQLSWSTWPSPNTPDPVTNNTTSQQLQAITDSSGRVLLQVYYYSNNIASVVSPGPTPTSNARGVAYWVRGEPTYSIYGAKDLEAVSAICTLTPDGFGNYNWGYIPMRNWYGYAQISNGMPWPPGGYETSPIMVWITSPSPNMYDPTTGAVYGGYASFAVIDYDGYGAVWRIIDSLGNRTIMEPILDSSSHAAASRITVQDAAGNIVRRYYTYWDNSMCETKRELVTSISGSGVETKITPSVNTYGDPQNPYKPSSILDANGHTWSYQWDRYGNPIQSIAPKGTQANYTFDYSSFALGQLTSVQQGTRTTSSIVYNANNTAHYSLEPIPGEVGTGSTQATTFGTATALGNSTTITSPGNNASSTKTLTYEYSVDGAYSQSECLGKPILITDNLGHKTHIRYDDQGNITKLIDADGNTTDFEYNAADQVVTVWRQPTASTGSGRASTTYNYLYPGGPVTITRDYSEAGSLVREQKATYNAEGDLLTSSGTSDIYSATYNAAHDLVTLTTGRAGDFGKTTHYVYDLAGRTVGITMPLSSGSSGADTITYSYDAVNNLVQRIDGNGSVTTYAYNDLDGLLSDVSYVGSSSNDYHLTYDTYDRIVGITDGVGTFATTYDDLDTPLSATQTYSSLSPQDVTYTYYADGSRHTMTSPGGTTTYRYDGAGRYSGMDSPAGTSVANYSDGDRLLSSILPNGVATRYVYQGSNQAQGVLVSLGNDALAGVARSTYGSFSYDGLLNETAFTSSISGVSTHSGTTTYSYSSPLDRLTQEVSSRAGGYSNLLTFDHGGNATSFRGTTRTFNANDQSVAQSYDGNGNPFPTYNSLSTAFDPENRLIQLGSVTAGYRADGLRAWKDTGSTRTYYLYDGSTPVVELNSTGSVVATNVYDPEGLVARQSGGVWSYFQFDPQGNVSEISDSTGSIIESRIYDAFGAEDRIAAPGHTLGTDPFGFNARWGYYLDRETGLYYCQNRYYDPGLGAWINRDLIGYQSFKNLYAYSNLNPVGYFDIDGLQVQAIKNPNGRYDDQFNRAVEELHGQNLKHLYETSEWTGSDRWAIHHLFPQMFRSRFEQFFDDETIDRYCIRVPTWFHVGAHSGVGLGYGGWWNKMWANWFADLDKAKHQPTRAEAFEYLSYLRQISYLGGKLDYVKYKK